VDTYHTPDNKLFATIQEKTKPLREGEVERRDYAVAHIKMG
jgi:hypothetical protein